MSDVATFNFDDVHLPMLADFDTGFGNFEGEAHIDEEGAIVAVTLYGYAGRKGAAHTVQVPVKWPAQMSFHEAFLHNLVDYLNGSYQNSIEEALNDWRESLHESEPEFA